MISKDFCMYVRKKNDKLKGRKSQQRKNKYVKKKKRIGLSNWNEWLGVLTSKSQEFLESKYFFFRTLDYWGCECQ